MNYLADVNVWLALALIGHVHHTAAHAWFEERQTGQVLFSRITQMGLLRLLTNRHVMGANVLAASDAWDLYKTLCRDHRVRYAAEPAQLEQVWRNATRHLATGPIFWTDAYLAAFAEAGDYTIVTFDRGFRRHHGVPVRLLELL
jgi:uncharacterized protein